MPFAAAAWLYPFTAWPGRPVATRTRPRSLIIIATRLRTGTDMPSFRTNIAFSRSAVTHRRSSAVMTATMNPRSVRPAPSALGPAHTPRIAGREAGVAHPSDTETPCRAQNTTREPHTTASRNRPPLRRTHDGAGGPSQGATSQAEFKKHPYTSSLASSQQSERAHSHANMNRLYYRLTGDTHNPTDLLIFDRSQLASARYATATGGKYVTAGDSGANAGHDNPCESPSPPPPDDPPDSAISPTGAKRSLSEEPHSSLSEKMRRSIVDDETEGGSPLASPTTPFPRLLGGQTGAANGGGARGK